MAIAEAVDFILYPSPAMASCLCLCSLIHPCHTRVSIFAALFKDGNLTKTYWGYPDFFVHREATIVSFKVELDQGVEVYSMHPKGDERLVAGLPENGQLVMRDVSKDDQILLTMVLEGHAVPTEISWLWICMPRADGRSEDPWIFSTL